MPLPSSAAASRKRAAAAIASDLDDGFRPELANEPIEERGLVETQRSDSVCEHRAREQKRQVFEPVDPLRPARHVSEVGPAPSPGRRSRAPPTRRRRIRGSGRLFGQGWSHWRNAIRRPESVSVVIPTSRGGADLEPCLVSLAAQRTKEVEVIVVDNASDDAALAAAPGPLPRTGASAQRVEPRFRRRVQPGHRDRERRVDSPAQRRHGAASGCAGSARRRPAAQPLMGRLPGEAPPHGGSDAARHRRIVPDDDRLPDSSRLPRARSATTRRPTRSSRPRELRSCCAGAALEQVGTFDSDFFAYFEETDLCWRLWLAGWEVGFAAEARVLHKLGATAVGLPSDFVQFHSFKNRLCTLLKNLGLARAVVDAALPRCALPWTRGLVRACAASRGSAARSSARWRGMSPHFPATLRKRREVQRIRRVS